MYKWRQKTPLLTKTIPNARGIVFQEVSKDLREPQVSLGLVNICIHEITGKRMLNNNSMLLAGSQGKKLLISKKTNNIVAYVQFVKQMWIS